MVLDVTIGDNETSPVTMNCDVHTTERRIGFKPSKIWIILGTQLDQYIRCNHQDFIADSRIYLFLSFNGDKDLNKFLFMAGIQFLNSAMKRMSCQAN